MVDKNIKIKAKIEKYKEFRNKLSEEIKNDKISNLQKFKIMKILDKTSKGSVVKYRNRCAITGRPRAYSGSTGLCRNIFRQYASFGMIIGVKKSS